MTKPIRYASLVLLLLLVAVALQTAIAAPPPPRAQRPEDAVADLNLTPDRQQKADALVKELRNKEHQAREDFLKQMAGILTPEQLRQLTQKIDQPHPPGDGPRGPGNQPAAANVDAPKGTVIFQGGYETDPRDRGRPVVLVAAGLGVTPEVFRDAFSGVKPAGPGEEPQDEQVRKNKATLLDKLGPHGITNDQLDTVSNYYRYNQSKGEMWKNTPAAATAIITNGVVTEIKLTNAGAGYSSPPTIVVVGYENVHAVVALDFSTDLKTNGSIKSITLSEPHAK